MFWWRQQSNLKKVLYMGAALSLAAGVSAGNLAIVGGVLLFFIFFIAALLIPNKKLSPKEKEWKKLITPKTYGPERNMKIFLSIVATLLFIVSSFFLFRALLYSKYNLALICGFAALICLSSVIYFNPRLYNEFYTLQKIVPLRKAETTKELYESVESIQTPFGTPLMGLVEGINEPVAVYRIIDFNWIVFFYVRHNEVIIKARNMNTSDEVNFNESDWVVLFTQQLANLFSYMENTQETPDSEILNKIFELPYKNYQN